MSILVHEVFKLLCHAEASDVQIVRLGTSGGLGVEPGTVIVASEAVNPEGRPVLEQVYLGVFVDRSSLSVLVVNRQT